MSVFVPKDYYSNAVHDFVLSALCQLCFISLCDVFLSIAKLHCGDCNEISFKGAITYPRKVSGVQESGIPPVTRSFLLTTF